MMTRGLLITHQNFHEPLLLSAMRKPIAILLLCLSFAGQGASLAETSPPDRMVYQSIIAADGVQHIRIEGGSYFFQPNHLIVHVNVPVELTVSVERGLIPHTIVIHAPEAGIEVDQNLSSDAKTIRFIPTAVGKYHFYCKNRFLFFKSHREKGMQGVLEVVE